MKKTVLFNLFISALIVIPALATAESGAVSGSQIISKPNNSLLAAQPAIAKSSVYSGENQNTDNSAQNKDILITPPKDVIGGSGHQINDISPYLGINY